MSGKSLIPLVIGLGVGGFALKMVFDTVRNAKGAAPKTVGVWAARDDVPRGVALDETMIEAVDFPTGSIPDGAFQNKEDLIGRVPRLTAPKGLPILESMLLEPGARAGLWVKPGYRAVSIRIDESSGVSNLLQPGSRVDVVGYFKVNKRGRQETISRTLLEDIEVCAVGARFDMAVEENGQKRGVTPARAVTLFVKPDGVPQIHLAEQMGRIKLSMRNSDDRIVRNSGDSSNEEDVLGIAADDSPVAGNGLLDKIKEMFKQRDDRLDQIEHTRQQAPIRVAQADPEAEPAWTMRVWNGDGLTEFGWRSLDSREPFQVVPKSAPRQAPVPAPVAAPAPAQTVNEPAKTAEPVDIDWKVSDKETNKDDFPE